MNLVILKGNLTRDPQLSFTPNQVPVCDFGLAVNKKWTGQDGQKREEVCFVDCRAFNRTAEVINEHFNKGKPILLNGELHFSQWEKEGRKHSKLRVTVRSFEFLGGNEQPQQQPQQSPQQQYQPAPQQDYAPPAQQGDPELIPF
jgi:single-strand DNA-binding protein